jgi:hypothetical protein
VYLPLRAWDGGQATNYDMASRVAAVRGKSLLFSVQTGATIVNGNPGLPPVRTDAFPSFSVEALPAEGDPKAVSITSSNGVIVIGFLGAANETYVVEANTNLATGAWSPISTNLAGADATFSLTEAPSSTCKYYRTRVY